MKIAIALAYTSLLSGCAETPEDIGDLKLGETAQGSICGSTNDAQHVNNYNGTFGPSVAFVQAHQRSKGALETSASADAGSKYCSGSLIASDLFLTAGHCVDSSTVGDYVAFNYERAVGSTTVLEQTHVRVSEVVEDSLGGLDYAVLRLEGNPGDAWGISGLATADAVVGAAISIIGHPNAEPKQLAAGTVASLSSNYLHYGNLDTLGGSSGSGILDSAGRIVGVHTNGGCTATGGTNSGVRIARICAMSSVMSEVCGGSDLIVRDSTGTLLLFPFQNGTFYGDGDGVQVGHGFNFTHYLVGNWSGNGTDDLIVRDSAGTLFLFPFRNGTFYTHEGGIQVGHGFNFTHYFVGNWTGDGTDDMIVRDSAGTL
jgi:V8-like Glu-specific endopeptidase